MFNVWKQMFSYVLLSSKLFMMRGDVQAHLFYGKKREGLLLNMYFYHNNEFILKFKWSLLKANIYLIS